MFSAYGEVADCYMPRNHASGQSRGFGFIRYKEEAEAEAAIKGCDGVVIEGRDLRHSNPSPSPSRNLSPSPSPNPHQAGSPGLDRPARAPRAAERPRPAPTGPNRPH